MDYKGGKHLTNEHRVIVEKFEQDRKLAISKRMEDFFDTNDLFEQEQIKTYIKNNFILYMLSVMFLYEDSLIYSGFNELTETEKYKSFLKFYMYKIEKEKLTFLSNYNTIMGFSFTTTMQETFLSYEQNILNLFEALKLSNKNFKYICQ